MRPDATSVHPRPRAVDSLLAALTAALLIFAVQLATSDTAGGSAPLDGWLPLAIMAGAAVLLTLRAALLETDRHGWAAFAAAAAIYALAGLIDLLIEGAGVNRPGFSITDLLRFVAYGSAYAGIFLLLRARTHSLRFAEWIDGLIGALAVAAAVTAVALVPLLRTSNRANSEVVLDLGYAIGDLVLLIFVGGAILILGRRPGRGWWSLAAGLAVFGAADVTHLVQMSGEALPSGPMLDLGWPLAATLVAFAAWQPMTGARFRPRAGIAHQGVLWAFATMAITVLAADLMMQVNRPARGLAITAMVLIVARLIITARESQQLERLSTRRATTDELTRLPNRRGFVDRIDRDLEAWQSDAAASALMLLDLDHFKEFNDSLGHAAGDRLLQMTAERIRRSVPEGTFVARLSGDEFCVILPAGTDRAATLEAAAKVADELSAPVHVGGVVCRVDASIGVALFPDHGHNRGALLRRADIAMHEAKESQSRIVVFDEAHVRLSRDHIELAADLRRAIERGEFVLHYQPKASMTDGRITSVEALLRWNHPVHGLLAPDSFLPFGERYGLMRRITRHVLHEALLQRATWAEAGMPLSVAVNISGADLRDDRFADDVAATLAEFETDAQDLRLEITEDTVMLDPERSLRTLGQLEQLGVSFALDDFGTGRASLAYLLRLPVGELKIDRSFIDGMQAGSHEAGVIVTSTIAMAHDLGMTVVAEGVSTADAWSRLEALGCDTAQGAHISYAVPAAEIPALVKRRRGSGTWAA